MYAYTTTSSTPQPQAIASMGDKKQCWQCLKQRLVCDSSRPGCKKCLTRKVQCPGYGTKKPLTWLKPGQTKSKRLRSNGDAQVLLPTFKDCSGTTEVMEATRYFNTHICPDLVANGVGGGFQCPFTLHPDEVPHVPAAARHTIVSIALAHRILKSECGFELDQRALSRKLQNQRGEAIRELVATLGPGVELSDYTLAAILTFLLAEIQQSFSPDWRQHCDAANAFIDNSGGMLALILCRPFQRPLVRYLILSEIMSSTTAPMIEEDRVQRQMDLLPMIHAVFCVGLYTSVPCPPELLTDIITVNHLVTQGIDHGVTTNFEPPRTAMGVLQKILSFSSEKWASEIVTEEQKHQDPKIPFSQRRALSWDWQAIAQVFQNAVALYCMSSLLYPHYTGQAPPAALGGRDIAFVRLTCLDALLRDLKAIASAQGQLRKFLVWPLAIAGIEVDVNDGLSKSFISSELTWISKTLGTASPLVAQNFLTALWKSEWIPTGCGRGSWNSIFDKPYIFIM
ncbi:hypothetical protein F66182_7150 [Fusarium sp. NRRL 66182]|nr:hypothetical protein F66182_7150 [Fusarium sp. NRRL 66182]